MSLQSETSTVAAEQAELHSLISQHLALKNALDFPELEHDVQPVGVLWPPKIFNLGLDTYNSRRPSLTTLHQYSVQLPTLRKNRKMTEKRVQFHIIHGSKLHRLPRKEAPYPLSYDRAVLDRLSPSLLPHMVATSDTLF
jgi:hypothetical protein